MFIMIRNYRIQLLNTLAIRLANLLGPICGCRIHALRIVVVQLAAVEYPPRLLSRRTHSSSIDLVILQELFTCNLRYVIVSAIYEELIPSVE